MQHTLNTSKQGRCEGPTHVDTTVNVEVLSSRSFSVAGEDRKKHCHGNEFVIHDACVCFALHALVVLIYPAEALLVLK